MIEQMPECRSGQFADMRGIVYDNAKSARSGLICDFRQKLLICLAALENLNTLSQVESVVAVFDRFQPRLREGISLTIILVNLQDTHQFLEG